MEIDYSIIYNIIEYLLPHKCKLENTYTDINLFLINKNLLNIIKSNEWYFTCNIKKLLNQSLCKIHSNNFIFISVLHNKFTNCLKHNQEYIHFNNITDAKFAKIYLKKYIIGTCCNGLGYKLNTYLNEGGVYLPEYN